MTDFNAELAGMAADIIDVMATGTITLRQRAGGTLDAPTGAVAGQTTTDVVGLACVRMEDSPFSMGGAEVDLLAGEIGYVVLASAAGEAREGWYVLDGDVEMRISRVERPANGHLLALMCRKARSQQT